MGGNFHRNMHPNSKIELVPIPDPLGIAAINEISIPLPNSSNIQTGAETQNHSIT
ncbi:MAG: hypothetical protein J7K04_11765 [Spirochaetales bacterium]|nr:hypothetical protein [Spirochaetales bacterium]